MVKITNQFGDVKKGKQHTVVYQDHYGNQMRRMLQDKKDEHTRGQLEQRERFKTGIYFAKSLTKAQKDFIKSYMTEADIRSPDGLPTTWYSFVKKIAMTRPKVEMETEAGGGFTGIYADWNYRSPITINNQNGGELTNHQVLITLTPENIDYSHCNADGSDIRFTNNSGGALNYWLQEWINGGTSKVWVKVDNSPTGENVCGLLYYGNTEATSESNGDNTFMFFDDFPGTTIDTDKWEGNTGNVAVSGGIATLSGSLKYIHGKPNISLPAIFTSKAKMQNADIVGALIATGDQLYANGEPQNGMIYYSGASPGPYLRSYVSSSQYTIETGVESTLTNYEIREFKIYSGATKTFYDSILEWEETTHVPTADQNLWYHSRTNNNILIDWVHIREYASTEPTSALGDEETGSGQNVLTSFKIKHPAIKSYEILDNGPKEENLSDLENHISTVITRTNLNLTASKIVVKTLANQEYTFLIK